MMFKDSMLLCKNSDFLHPVLREFSSLEHVVQLAGAAGVPRPIAVLAGNNQLGRPNFF